MVHGGAAIRGPTKPHDGEQFVRIVKLGREEREERERQELAHLMDVHVWGDASDAHTPRHTSSTLPTALMASWYWLGLRRGSW